ncbi:MAG: response regulator [Myxococcaceae bacterium]|nr:response regulator [Myxococcaceae bacterium]
MSAHPPARVLVIEDNPTLRENLEEILEAEGYRVSSVGTCVEARQQAMTPFEVALLDVKLPDGDGNALAAELKEAQPDAEVVMLTGFATVESAAAAVGAGAWAYLLKPVPTPALLQTVAQAIRQVRLKHDKRALALRARVAEKLAAVGTMTAGLSHEIRNPLNSATLQLTVLERRIARLPEELQPPLREPLTLVKDEIRRLDQLVVDFLQLSRPRELRPGPVDLPALLQRTVDFLAEDAQRRQVELRVDFATVPPARGDEEQLRQVFMNLALNALDAAPRGGFVRLSTRSAPAEVVAAVEDNGPGIAPELAQRIFEPFFTTKPQGSGLGLPICHAIVSQHGGSIEVGTSDAGGARFEVRLPALL